MKTAKPKKLTDPACKYAKPQDKPYKLHDTDGMFLLVNPNGSKWWRLRYTLNGKDGLVSLGVYPDVPLEAARTKRDEARVQIASGLNPATVKAQEREDNQRAKVNTFEAVADQFIKANVKRWAETHTATLHYRLANFILPNIGKRPIAEIKPADLTRFIKPLATAGTIETAKRVRMVCGQVFRYAVAEGLIDSDPTRDLRGIIPSRKPKSFSALLETADIARLMRDISGYQGTPEVRTALKLSAYLFQRPGEMRTMRWAEIDWDKCQWRYTVSKTKTAHIVPLAPQAVELLRNLQTITGRSEYVFPSARGGTRPMSENAVRVALRTMGYSNEQMTPHGFRAMARSTLAELDWKTDSIERQLAHKPAGPLGAAYDRAQFLPERTKMMTAWANHLDGLEHRSNVVPLRAAG